MSVAKKGSLLLCAGVAAFALAGWWGTRRATTAPVLPAASSAEELVEREAKDAGVGANADEAAEGSDPAFRRPTGEAPALTCDEARSIVAQVGEELAFDPPPVKPEPFASAVADWVDPHGFWAASSSSPPNAAIAHQANALATEIAWSRGDCTASKEIGKSLARWVGDLHKAFTARLEHPHAIAFADAVTEPVLDDATTKNAETETVEALADRLAALKVTLGGVADPIVAAAEHRYFPELDADGWSRVVLAAAVRGYVPIVDPHGAWAPLDEEASVYEIDLDAHPPEPLWEKVTRTAAGAKIESGALAPLRDGDVIVELDHMLVAGLSLEQVEQLGIVAAESHDVVDARVIREGETVPRSLKITAAPPPKDDAPPAPRDDLESHRVAYGDADVGVIAIREVRDDLGEALARTVDRLAKGERRLAGIVLDLRGNGGGSTEGAVEALSIFLPSVQLFPMKRRDGTIETEATEQPPLGEAYKGPLATLVDGSTASAAEMIAGALASYHRAPTVGTRTYGKGCAQEYEDDDPRTGVLRLTTLLYALPDGTAVQRIGLAPMFRVPFAPLPGEDDTTETEAKLEGAPPTWKGPDMRTMDVVTSLDRASTMAWPAPSGAARSCDDADVCRALRVLAAPAKVSVPRARR